jgi:peptidoglycan/LPS O-acetylase OafA/YrhL
MAGNAEGGGGRRGSRWRIAAWTVAALILLLPLFAMQVTDEVDWDVADFAIFGAMLVGAGGTYELAARVTGDSAYRAAVGVALAAAFLLIWLNLAVGIVGTEDNPFNLMFGGCSPSESPAPSSRASSRPEWHARCSRRRSLRRWSARSR